MVNGSDTTTDASQVQRDILSRMEGSERLLLALRMSDEAREVTRDGIRHRHPEWSEAEIHAELLRLMLGRELANKVIEPHPTRP